MASFKPSKKIQISLPSTGEEEWKAVRGPLMNGWLTQGPKVEEFENAFAKRHQVRHAIATTSCTTGLHLILSALGIGPDDEVILPSFTWVATANAVVYCGATPVLADINPFTYTIDPEDVSRRVSSRTKAIIPVHLFGLCADRLDALISKLPSEVLIIEDAACASGAAYKGQPAGSLGTAGAFSFHPRKSITTGEGGMITTNDDELANHMRILRNHGASQSEEDRHLGPKPYQLPEFNLLGFNYRMTDLQGAVGLTQLKKLDRFIEERNKWALFYTEKLSNLNWLCTPSLPEYATHAWQAFVTYVDPQKAPMPRNKIMEYLDKKGIATRPGTHAVHMLGYYQENFRTAPNDYPAARSCNDNTMALPLHNCMMPEDYKYVVQSILELI